MYDPPQLTGTTRAIEEERKKIYLRKSNSESNNNERYLPIKHNDNNKHNRTNNSP